MLATPNTKGHPRIGVTISKKRAKRAVDRNRVKRVTRESFRQHQNLSCPVDIVVLARSHTSRMTNAELFDQLAVIWSKIAASKTLRQP